MEIIKAGFKTFNIIEKIGERTYKLERKGKYYFAKIFADDKVGFDDFLYARKHIYLCGISTPKVIAVDKKNRIVITEFIEGTSALTALIEGPLSDRYFDEIFSNSFFAKMEKMNLNYCPENWIMMNDKLYYINIEISQFTKEESFTEKYIRLWFYTKEFINYLNDLGIEADSTRLKQEYAINKEIVLTTCKFYR